MEKTGDEAAAKFINALIKSVQTLCHGYLDFQNGIEIIGHINLNVDKGSSLDYILKEKVCKNAENSTLFISNSFHAEPKAEQEVPGKQTGSQTVQNSEAADTGDSTKVFSAISSISSALTGIRDRRRESFSAKDSESSHSHHRTAKRKASEQSGDVCPAKVSSHHDGSHLSSDSPYHPNSSSPIDSKLGLQELADGESSEMLLPQTASVTDHTDIGVNLAGSVLEPVENQSNTDLVEREEDSDGDLEVTFIKEEYVEGDRSACEFDNSSQQYVGGPHDRNSEGMVDPSVFPVSLHSSSAPSTYVPSAHDPGAVGQQFSGGVPSQPQPGPSGTRGNVSQQQAAQPLPPGARPGCGYVHPSDAQKWRDVGGDPSSFSPGGSGLQQQQQQDQGAARGISGLQQQGTAQGSGLQPQQGTAQGSGGLQPQQGTAQGSGLQQQGAAGRNGLQQQGTAQGSGLQQQAAAGGSGLQQQQAGGSGFQQQHHQGAAGGSGLQQQQHQAGGSGLQQQQQHQGAAGGSGLQQPQQQGSAPRGGGGGTEAKNVSREELERLLLENLSIKDMAQRLGMSRPTLYKLLKKHKLDCAFKYATNEQIVEMMNAVVMEHPLALTDPALMSQRLMLSGLLAVSEKRLLSCMRRLQKEMNLTFQFE